MGPTFGVNIFEELEDDAGVVKGFSFIGESGNQSFGITSFMRQVKVTGMQVGKCGDAGCKGAERLSNQTKVSSPRLGSFTSKRNVIIERIGFHVFVANSAFL